MVLSKNSPWEEMMPELAKNYANRYSYDYPHAAATRLQPVPDTIIKRKIITKKPVKKTSLVHRIISIAFVLLIGIFVLPISFNKVTSSFFHGGSPYPHIKVDYQQLRFPTADYLSNHYFLGERSLRGARVKKPLMSPIKEKDRMHGLETELKNLMNMYPAIHPSVYVWNYADGSFADVNADESFAAASIIKLPVLAHLFRSVELGQMTIYDEMTLTDYYRAEGSGSLQFKASNSKYSIDKLARMMITESDNSSTNMLMAQLGSMNDVNHGIREWGLKHTYVQTWLPDLGGTNRTTAREMARILYNIDNPDFLSITSREKIFDYMGHVENNRLIKAGLGNGAVFLHKTGDIGKMLGDAGIVLTPNNKKYVVVILANRPHNSPQGKEFIVKASELIYNRMVY